MPAPKKLNNLDSDRKMESHDVYAFPAAEGPVAASYLIKLPAIGDEDPEHVEVVFQSGQSGTDSYRPGIHIEDLLRIVAHRLETFQATGFRCRENAIALTHLETAALWIKKRTDDRIVAGTEGTQIT